MRLESRVKSQVNWTRIYFLNREHPVLVKRFSGGMRVLCRIKESHDFLMTQQRSLSKVRFQKLRQNRLKKLKVFLYFPLFLFFERRTHRVFILLHSCSRANFIFFIFYAIQWFGWDSRSNAVLLFPCTEGSTHQAFRILAIVFLMQFGKDSISQTIQSMRCLFSSQCAWQAGFKTIADIGKERIARAAKQLEGKTGFRVLKIGDSNFKDCSLPPHEYKLEDLEDMADNLLPNRNPLDLLFEAMWILGLDLHSPIQTKTIQNKQVFFVGDNHAIACFEEELTEEFAKALVQYKPRRVVFLDGGFASDAVRINIEQLFQQLSPATHITIL